MWEIYAYQNSDSLFGILRSALCVRRAYWASGPGASPRMPVLRRFWFVSG